MLNFLHIHVLLVLLGISPDSVDETLAPHLVAPEEIIEISAEEFRTDNGQNLNDVNGQGGGTVPCANYPIC